MATTPSFNGALMFLNAAFHGDMDAIGKRAYEVVLDGIDPELVMAGVRRLINEAAAGREFYGMPKPYELLKACADVVRERRSIALGQIPHCEICDDKRWKTIEVNGVARMTRCNCWEDALRRMDEAAPKLALPSIPKVDRDEN